MKKFGEQLQWFGIFLLSLCYSVPADAAGNTVGGRTLHLEPTTFPDHTPEFCALDPKNARDASLLRLEAEAEPNSEVLTIWIDCAEFREWHESSKVFDSYVIVSAPKQRGAVEPFDIPLSSYLTQVKAITQTPEQARKWAAEDGAQTYKDALAKMGVEASGLASEEAEMLGLIGDDASAVYVGSLQKITFNGVGDVQCAVTGYTELNGVAVTFGVFDVYTGPETIQILLHRAATIAADFVAKNPTSVP